MTPTGPLTFFATKAFAIFAILIFGSACDRKPENVEITESRDISIYDPSPKVGASPGERLGTGRVLSIRPDGWVSRESDDFANLKFSFGKRNEGELTFSILRSDDGSDFVIPNIDRWRQQMGQPPITPEEAAALDEIPLFGQNAKKIVIDGAYSPVAADAAKPGYRLVGALLQIPQFTFFVKMTGPRQLVEAEEKNFDEFTSTLQFR